MSLILTSRGEIDKSHIEVADHLIPRIPSPPLIRERTMLPLGDWHPPFVRPKPIPTIKHPIRRDIALLSRMASSPIRLVLLVPPLHCTTMT
jgi:hypothetical protein